MNACIFSIPALGKNAGSGVVVVTIGVYAILCCYSLYIMLFVSTCQAKRLELSTIARGLLMEMSIIYEFSIFLILLILQLVGKCQLVYFFNLSVLLFICVLAYLNIIRSLRCRFLPWSLLTLMSKCCRILAD